MIPSTHPPIPPCPKCSALNARWLEFTSLMNKVDAFQCPACGEVWTSSGTLPAKAET
jgi:Zn-finger nucleic acid-binding protein